MKIFVHYGKAKTGTTAIQHTLASNTDLLLRYGVLYPRFEHISHTHQMLAIGFKETEKLHPNFMRMFEEDADAVQTHGQKAWDDLKEQIERHKPETLILSGEEFFSGMTVTGQTKFRERLSEFSDDIQLSVYLREPAAHYLSLACQNANHMISIAHPYAANDRRRISIMDAAFERQTDCLIYDRSVLLGGDIVQDFTSRYLPAVPFEKIKIAGRANPSLSPEASSIAVWYTGHFHTERTLEASYEFGSLRQIMRDIEVELGSAPKPRLKGSIRNTIIRASTDLLWLLQERNVRFPSVNYDLIDGTPVPKLWEGPTKIDDIVDLDQNWKDRVMAGITHTAVRLRSK